MKSVTGKLHGNSPSVRPTIHRDVMWASEYPGVHYLGRLLRIEDSGAVVRQYVLAGPALALRVPLEIVRFMPLGDTP